MDSVLAYVILGLWLVWLAIWLLAAGHTKETLRGETVASRLRYTVPLWIAAWLLISRRVPWNVLNARFVPFATWLSIVAVVMVALGLAFAGWARVYIGRNWSADVTLKRDHELVRSGPYRWVRNPIYTGILFALAGTALMRGQWSGVFAVVIAFGSFWYKARLEERVMHAAFGAEYEAYKREVASLIPFVL